MKKISGYESAQGRVFKHKANAVAQDLVDLADSFGEEIDFNVGVIMANKAGVFIRCLQQMEEGGE